MAGDDTIAEEEEVVDEPNSGPVFTPPSGLTAGDDNAATAENDLLKIDVLANDVSWSGISDLHIDSVSLASGEGSVRIEGGTVVYDPGAAYDHLAVGEQAIVTLSYQVSDNGGQSDRGSVTITVMGANDGPVGLTLVGGAVDENAAASTVVATLSATDADAGDSFSYALTADPSGFFEIVGNQVRVAAGANIDYEVAASHDVTIRVTDSNGASYDEVVTLTVDDLIDETPTDITLTGGAVDENAAASTVVATLSTTDADAGDSFSYALTADPSGFFEIVGNQVRVASGANIDYEVAASHDVTIRVTDSNGASYDEVVTLTVDDLIDETPTDITLTGGAVDENAAASTVVATLSATDADAGDSFSYALTADPSGFFEIVGNQVRVASGANIDYEVAASHDVTIRVTDSNGASYDEVVTLTVDDLIDETPTDITLTGGAVDENAAASTVVATLSATDADAGDSFSYALTADPSGFFEIVGNQVRVTAGANIDYEVAASHDVTIRVTDSNGASYDEVVTLTVDDLIDETPTDITLTGGAVDENAAASTVVATLSATDADAGDSFSYALTADPSGFFEIVGNQVRVTAGANIDYEVAASHDVTIRVTDSGGASYDEVVTVNVMDANDAPVDLVFAGASQDFIENGSFEAATGNGATATLSGWSFSSGSYVDTWHASSAASWLGDANSIDGNYHLDLDAGGSNARIAQDVDNLIDGQTYELTFDYSDYTTAYVGASSGGMNVYWGGELVAHVGGDGGKGSGRAAA